MRRFRPFIYSQPARENTSKHNNANAHENTHEHNNEIPRGNTQKLNNAILGVLNNTTNSATL